MCLKTNRQMNELEAMLMHIDEISQRGGTSLRLVPGCHEWHPYAPAGAGLADAPLPHIHFRADFGYFLFNWEWGEGGFADVYLQFAFDGLDVDFAAFGDVGQQDAQAERHCQ